MRLSENVYILWFSGQKFDSIFRLSEISRFSDRLYIRTPLPQGLTRRGEKSFLV